MKALFGMAIEDPNGGWYKEFEDRPGDDRPLASIVILFGPMMIFVSYICGLSRFTQLQINDDNVICKSPLHYLGMLIQYEISPTHVVEGNFLQKYKILCRGYSLLWHGKR